MAAHTALLETDDLARLSSDKALELVERGLPLASVADLKNLGLTFTEIAEIVIAPRTLKHRKDRGENLSTAESERVLRVRKVIAMADRVFGNHEKAMHWLRGADDRLKDRSALDVLRTEAGGKTVEEMLWCIAEGMFT